METLETVHSLVRWLVLIALVGGAGFGFWAASAGRDWQARPYSIALVVFDIQVTIGILLWILDSAWEEGVFFAAIHPITMLLALGVAHMSMARARKDGSTTAHRMIAIGLAAALVLVLLGLPR